MILALRIAHIAIAAAWFGHKLLIPGDIRRSISGDPDLAGPFLDRLRRAERFGQLTGIGTLLSGVALLGAVGVETVDVGVWIGLGLVVTAIAVGAIVARPASTELREAVGRGDRVEATIAARRISQVLSVESVLWVGALVAMVA
jgi:hypothetical protein